ncbi:uncharacterized protein [Aegilops tauschii subsp. strangulata]|uniref:uncharacterized protein n=1 Tax=Aegilops tauschii subsp. strangulata TaxID=200361 RepID=UPI003CC888A7
MVLDDFNMILRANEKSNTNINHTMMNKFRSFVDSNELKELYMHGRRFTWSSERENPTLTRIDRVLVSVDWEMAWLDFLLQALSTSVSDHAALHITTSAAFCPKKRFRFETFWPKLEGLEQAVKDAWVCDPMIIDPFKRHDALFRNAGVALQAWGQKKVGNVKLLMAVATLVIHRLDQAMESRGLTELETWLRRTLKLSLLGLASLERTIERQRSSHRWIREGDANTKFFQVVANGRRAKNFIPHVRVGNEVALDQSRKEEIFADAFQNLLGTDHVRRHTLDLRYLGMEESDLSELEGIFLEEEVWNAVKEMHPDRAPGPDGFIALFCQRAWPVIKNDILAALTKLAVGDSRGFAKLN